MTRERIHMGSSWSPNSSATVPSYLFWNCSSTSPKNFLPGSVFLLQQLHQHGLGRVPASFLTWYTVPHNITVINIRMHAVHLILVVSMTQNIQCFILFQGYQEPIHPALIDVVQPKMFPFSTNHLIWVNYKVVSQLFDLIYMVFSYLNSVWHFQALNCVVINFSFHSSRENRLTVFSLCIFLLFQ